MKIEFQSGLDSPKKYLTVDEVSEYLRVSPRTIHRWLKQGRIKALRVGNTSRIALEDLNAFIQSNTREGRDEE